MEESSKEKRRAEEHQTFFLSVSHTQHAQIMSSNAAEKAQGVWIFHETAPLAQPPPNLLTSTRVQRRRRRRKVGHVCRFNEAKAPYDKLIFSLPVEPLSSNDRLRSIVTHSRRFQQRWLRLVRGPFSDETRRQSPIDCMSPQSCLIVFSV